MHIKVFGPGCAKCVQAEKIVREVVASRCCCGVTVEKVSDLAEMMKHGIISTPAVMVDDEVKLTGRLPSKAEIEAWLDGGLAGEINGGPDGEIDAKDQKEGACCPVPTSSNKGGCGCGSGGCC